jgi:hypothetical protein
LCCDIGGFVGPENVGEAAAHQLRRRPGLRRRTPLLAAIAVEGINEIKKPLNLSETMV